MAQVKNNWELFGFDVRRIGVVWRAAWREFLWGDDSPVRARLDEVVCVEQAGGTTSYYHAGSTTAASETSCKANVLPAELVLLRSLRIPLAAEAEIETVLALEVGANSPFPEADTSFGWHIRSRDEQGLEIDLAIASTSAVMTWMGKNYDIHTPGEREIWAEVAGRFVVLQGFGEVQRDARYRRRLLRVTALLAAAVVVLLLIFTLASVGKRMELGRYTLMAERVGEQASQASAIKSDLLDAQDVVAEYNNLAVGFPSAHFELARVTELFSDEDYLIRLTMAGRELKLQGRSTDGAAVLQRLTQNPGYESVAATRAISKLGSSNLEQFSLTVQLSEAQQ
jgi:hypothetical protein